MNPELTQLKYMPILEQKITIENIEINIDFNCRFTTDSLLFVYVVKPKLLILVSFGFDILLGDYYF